MREAAGWWMRAAAVAGRRPTLAEIGGGDRVAVNAALRVLARAVPLPQGALLCRVLGRFKMVVDGADLSLTPHLALDGCWEMALTRALLQALRPGMRVADVGANVGYHTLLMAEAVGASGRVAAFEPNPAVLRHLRRNVVLNGFADRVEVHGEALGALDGEALHLNFDPEFLGGGHVAAAPHPDFQSALVTGRRLDGLPGASELELVKIDAEGSEAAVWSGMAGMLAGTRLRTVILEWEPSCHADPAAALAGYAHAGFSLGLLDPRDPVVPADAAVLLALPPGGARMLVLRR